VVLPTLRPQSYPVYDSDEFVNTTCELNDFRATVHVCRGSLSDFEITHRCNGTSGLLVSKCPSQSVQPYCSTSPVSAYACSVLNYTSSYVTCLCELSNGGRRSLSALSESGALEVINQIFSALLTPSLHVSRLIGGGCILRCCGFISRHYDHKIYGL
jgi:hypothetical protein